MITETKDRIQAEMERMKTFCIQNLPLFNRNRRKLLSRDRTEILVRRGRKAVQSIDTGSREAVIRQYRLLDELLKENRNTEYGKKCGFSDIHSA